MARHGCCRPAVLGKSRKGHERQFFITLEPCSHLKGKHTIFGHVVSGQEILDKIAKVAVDDNDRPLRPVLVSRCGELVQKKKQNRITTEDSAASNSRDRGRRRRSDSSDFDMSATPPPRPVQRHRRQSDNVIDEGLRGRPRQRSASHSPSLASQDSEEGDTALTEKHKRKRSPSPSRHKIAPTPSNDESSYEQRRRRSLPNQYAEDRAQRYRDDEDRYRPSPRRNDDRYAGRRDDRPRPRQNDRYRPRDRYTDFGRLGGGDGRLGSGDTSENDPPVKYKGRGSMKYREPGRL